MKVQNLMVTHVKGAREVAVLDADPTCVEVAGLNGMGKSSILDSIVYALGGKRAVASDPITHGEQHAEIVLDTEAFTINRTFKRDGKEYKTLLKIVAKDTGDYKQRDLDALLGNFAFDPLAFARLKPAEQIDKLKALAGANVCQELNRLDSDISQWEQDRLLAGRGRDNIGAIRPVEPAEAVDVSALVAEKERLENYNREQELQSKAIERAQEGVNTVEVKIKNLKEELAEAERQLTTQVAGLEELPLAEDMISLEEIKAKLSAVDENNRLAQEYQNYLNNVQKHQGYVTDYENADEQIKALRAKRLEIFAAAALPLPGLRFDGTTLYYGETPFDQLSSAERYKVSASIGMAALPPSTSDRPHLRIMMIKDGSLLDSRSFAGLKAMAEEHQCQLWIETVGKGHNGDSILIEEGKIISHEEWQALRESEDV